jgi:two-component system LytT family response regulator
MKLKALIVEEEKSAAQKLHGLLEKNCSQVKVTGVCFTAGEAASFIEKENIDVLFLNAEMPGSISPEMHELVDSTQLYTVFMATHQDYAIKAIKQNADDFLQKPIDAGELVISMNKAQEHFDKPKSTTFGKSSPTLPVNTQAGIFLLNKEDIIYIKADGRYSELYCRDE